MGLFSKNPNEVVYTGGKKHFTDVIKNTGDGNLLIWRQPEEDFNTNSTLIVMPGEEAIFVKGGNIEKTFEEGTYKLSTQNYPFISRLRNSLSGGISTFNCVVYFVRKAHSKEIAWGTSSPIQVRDKVHNIRTSVKARGAYKIKISNPSLFLAKCIGNNVPYETQGGITEYFSSELQSTIKNVIANLLNSLETELIGLDTQLSILSEKLTPMLSESFESYGINCVRFSLSGLDVDTTKYDQLDSYTIAGTGKVINAQADKNVMDVLGNRWGEQQQVNILTNMSNNQNSGMGMIGAEIAMGLTSAQVFSNMSKNIFNNQTDANTAEDPVEKIKSLKQMLDLGAITQEDYDKKKSEILSRL